MRATKAAIKIIATPISTTMKFVEERGPLMYSNNQSETRGGWDGETIPDFERIHGGFRHFVF